MRAQTSSLFASLPLLSSICLLIVACGGETSSTDNSPGGTGGSGATAGTAGTSSAGTAGVAGTSGGGSGGSATGGSAGNGGDGGSAAGAGGSIGGTGGSIGGSGGTTNGGTGGAIGGSGGAIGGAGGGVGGMAGGPGALGDQCQDGAECQSGICYVVDTGFGSQGLCSECASDDDCVNITGFGCQLPNPADVAAGNPTWAKCNMGMAGENCQTDAACGAGLVCGLVASVPLANINIQTCGYCSDAVACDNGGVCNPNVDFMSLTGTNECVPAGSVAHDQTCPFVNGAGQDAVCAPNADGSPAHCTELSVSAFGMSIGIGIAACGDCATDNDCPQGQACTPADVQVDQGTFSITSVAGSKCQ